MHKCPQFVEWGAVRWLWLSDVWLGKIEFYIDNLQSTKTTRWSREVRARGTFAETGRSFYVHECKHREMRG
jgi:hypothetical protein